MHDMCSCIKLYDAIWLKIGQFLQWAGELDSACVWSKRPDRTPAMVYARKTTGDLRPSVRQIGFFSVRHSGLKRPGHMGNTR